MSKELKIAQMNTRAVTAKLAEYETRHAEQEQRIVTLQADMAELKRQMQQLQTMLALPGSGPTV